MKPLKLFLLVFFYFTILNSKSKAQPKGSFDWLLGVWHFKVEKGIILETWNKQNDSTYIGFSGLIQNLDTIPSEKIVLTKKLGKWYFTPYTLNQNNSNPIDFKIIFIGTEEFICENKKHDFPTRIQYRKNNNSLWASIEGISNRKFNKLNYDYTKIE